jgi:hypothetical protein
MAKLREMSLLLMTAHTDGTGSSGLLLAATESDNRR